MYQVTSYDCLLPTASYKRSPLQPLHQPIFSSPLNELLVTVLQVFSTHISSEMLGVDVDRAGSDHGAIVHEVGLNGK